MQLLGHCCVDAGVAVQLQESVLLCFSTINVTLNLSYVNVTYAVPQETRADFSFILKTEQ